MININTSSCNECIKSKYRSNDEKKKLIKRLSRIEGQIRGIKQMIKDYRYCDDIFIQITAITKYLKSLGKVILKNHLSSCVVEEIQNNNLDIINDIMN